MKNFEFIEFRLSLSGEIFCFFISCLPSFFLNGFIDMSCRRRVSIFCAMAKANFKCSNDRQFPVKIRGIPFSALKWEGCCAFSVEIEHRCLSMSMFAYLCTENQPTAHDRKPKRRGRQSERDEEARRKKGNGQELLTAETEGTPSEDAPQVNATRK